MTRRLIIECASFLLIVLFVYAAVTKLMSFGQFSVQIGQSPMLTPMRHLIAIVVPGVELGVSVLLAINVTRLLGLYASFALMALFTAYIIVVTQFSEHIPCSCGGVLEAMSWTEHLVFNIGFAILAGVAIILHGQAKITTPTGN
jgi:uncharacterized membrane protein YphA (DoxX/SURF4 family)